MLFGIGRNEVNQRRETGPGEVTCCGWGLRAARDIHENMVWSRCWEEITDVREMHKEEAEETRGKS